MFLNEGSARYVANNMAVMLSCYENKDISIFYDHVRKW